MVMKRQGAGSWALSSTVLDPTNPMFNELYMEVTNAVTTLAVEQYDFVSNGLKWRSTGANATNNSITPHIYMAFGIQPLTDGAINQVRADGRGSAPLAIATGGTITLDGNFAINTFRASGTIIFDKAPEGGVTYLVVAGGGGAGGVGASPYFWGGGGGGAGGYRTFADQAVGTGSFSIVVGAGGAGGGLRTVGASGGDSSAFGITSTGGGGGGPGGYQDTTINATAGGSSGGAGQYSGKDVAAIAASPVTDPVQGHAGGGVTNGTNKGGGGGGAGAVGATSTPNGSGGGAGVSNSISGSAVTYGTGGNTADSSAVGAANTGGGGGGSTGTGDRDGGAGGSGVVIVRYKYK